jgi:hypothetical protein
VQSTFQRGWWKQTSRDRIAPQIVERDRHPQMLSKSRRNSSNQTQNFVIPNRSEGAVRNLLLTLSFRTGLKDR